MRWVWTWLSLGACTSTPEVVDVLATDPSDTVEPVDTVDPATPTPVDSGDSGDSTVFDTDLDCVYPPGAVEPMAVGQVMPPYRWRRTLHADGRDTSLALARVPCATDPVIDFSVFDVLLFVSIPAW